MTWLGALFVLALFGGGCGGGELDAPARRSVAPATPVASETPLSLCTRAWETICPAYRQCLPAVFASEFESLGDCVAKNAEQCVRLKWADGSTDTIARETTCIQELPSAVSCRDIVEGIFDHTANVQDCVTPPGTRADGAACGYYVQCASGACRFPPDAVCGSCGAPVGLGGPCATTFDCVGGASCIAGVCVAPSREGDACAAASPCDLETRCANGTCVARAKEGAACPSEAPLTTCEADLSCNALGVCERARLATSVGEACGEIDGGLTLCTAGKVCVFAGGAASCARVAREGEACDGFAVTLGNPCEYGTECVKGVCVRPDPGACL